MIDYIVFALWFFLPAGAGNVAPVFAAKLTSLNSLDIPIDGNLSWRGNRIFGDHKTLRGLITGILAGIVVATLQFYVYKEWSYIQSVSPVDYSSLNPMLWGGLLAFGALAGDAIKSFFKRQIGVKPGSSWFPFDQIDYIIGGLLITLPFVALSLWEYLAIAIIWFVLHPISTGIGYLLSLKDSPI